MENRFFNWDGVRSTRLLPAGYYDMRMVELNETYTRERGMLMYVLVSEVVEPVAQKGLRYWEYMVFGTAPFDPGDNSDAEYIEYAELEDLEAEDPLTQKYSIGMQVFKRIFEAAGVELTADLGMHEIMDRVDSGGMVFGCRMSVQTDDSGVDRNRMSSVYPQGTQLPRLEEPPAATRRGARRTTTARRAESQGAMASRRTRNAAAANSSFPDED